MERLEGVYKKTYNFVYLRAKSILKKEEDIQQLMKEVYLKAVAEDIAEDKLYEWLGREVYTAGCNKFRKKKVREVQYIELDAQKYEAQENVDREQTKAIICEALENLPDMYLATVFALCFDHVKIKDIVTVMGYTSNAIINRLNYVNKYLEKSLENHRAEQGGEVQFSVELLCDALSDWCKDNRMSETVAQNVYASICREQGMVAENVCEEGENAGLERRINETESEGFRTVCEELQNYMEHKRTSNKSKGFLLGLGAILLVLTAGVLLFGDYIKRGEKQQDAPGVEEATNDEIRKLKKQVIELKNQVKNLNLEAQRLVQKSENQRKLIKGIFTNFNDKR